jgi:DNA primase
MILELLQSDGNVINRVATTGGGEYAGACPFCGGNDRFRVWPEQGEHGRWWCRQCGRGGDAIQYLRDCRKMSFREACEYVGKEINSFPTPLSSRRTTSPKWSPREALLPIDLWQDRAKRLIEESEQFLFSAYSFAQRMLEWLKERRGLSEETIRAYRLGLQPTNRFERHEQWGLDPDLKEDGTPKKILIPRGLTIPFCQDDEVYRIRIRRPKSDLKSNKDNRYHTLRGSSSKPMILEPDREVQVVLESDLDAMLLVQEAHGLVGAVSLGSAQKTPDEEAAALLRRIRLILVALDDDDAGGKAAWDWWLNHFPQARRWPPIEGKDPGDMWAAGVNLRDWIEAGIDYYAQETAAPSGEEVQSPPSQVGEAIMPIPSFFEGDHKELQVPLVQEHTLEAIGDLARKPQAPEHVTCFECDHFRPAVKSPNPGQAWGHCRKRNKGRYGVATACEALLVLDPDPGELRH